MISRSCRDRYLGQVLDDLDPLAADVEDAEERRARVGDRQRRAERGEREHGEREDEPAPGQSALPAGRDLREHGRDEIGRLRHRELAAEGDEGALEVVHGSTSTSARSRASARAVRDFTVPRRTSRTAAVSSSESSRK